MTINDLKAQAATRYDVEPSEVETTEAPNGGTVIWHHLVDEEHGHEDEFALCWVQTDGTVLWDEDPYGFSAGVAEAAGY